MKLPKSYKNPYTKEIIIRDSMGRGCSVSIAITYCYEIFLMSKKEEGK